MLKTDLVEEEFEGEAKYLTYKGSLPHHHKACKPEEEYQMVKFKYRKLVVKHFRVENNNVINDNSDSTEQGKKLCLT